MARPCCPQRRPALNVVRPAASSWGFLVAVLDGVGLFGKQASRSIALVGLLLSLARDVHVHFSPPASGRQKQAMTQKGGLVGGSDNQLEKVAKMKTEIQMSYIVLLALVLAACAAGNSAPTASIPVAPATPTPASSAGFANPEPSYIEIIPIDAAWNHYINHRLGFGMDIPTSMYRDDAYCTWREEGDYSYRPEAGKLPVVVIEGEDRAYITSQYDMVLTQPTQIASGAGYQYKYGGCELRENDLQLVAKRDYTSYIWEIVLRPIASDADLEALIDAVYGECFSLGELSLVEGRTYSRVKVLGDGKPVEESVCLLRGGYIFFYSPDLHIAATWYTGQSIHFPSEGINRGNQDSEMVDSFEFIPRVEAP